MCLRWAQARKFGEGEEFKSNLEEHLGGSVVEYLPSAQGMIPGSWDGVPHRAPHREPASPLPMSLPLSLSLYLS